MKTYWQKMKERRDAEEDGPVEESKKRPQRVGCLSIIGAIVVALILIQFIPGFVIGFKNGFEKETAPSSTSSSSEITYKKYQKLHEGMTYEKCCEILGSKGTATFNNKSDGVETKTYNWFGIGKSVYAVFQNNKLISSGQYGLE